MMKRLAIVVGLLLLFLAGFAGALLWQRLRHIEAQRAALPTPTTVPVVQPSPTVPVEATAEPAATPPTGFRLAGVALGAPHSFAVVEDPLGKSGLYRAGDPIDGLGRLRTIEAQRVVVDAPDGVVELRLAAAPPPTVTADYAVRFKRPTDSSGPITFRARVVEAREDRATVEGTVEANGVVCATCRGTFVAVKPGHPAYHRWE